MNTYAAVEVSHLSPYTKGHDSPLWWGILGLVVIECMVVACLITSYFYLRMLDPDWPPPGVDTSRLLLPTINLALLLLSSWCMYKAGVEIDHGRQRGLNIYVGIALALAASVLVLRFIEYRHVGFRWDEHAYGSIVWLMIGLHFAHVLSAIAGTGIMWIWALRGYFTPERQLGVVADTLYWQFVVFIWVPQYLVIHWVPRILGDG